MKKRFLLLSLALVWLAACTESEINPSEELSSTTGQATVKEVDAAARGFNPLQLIRAWSSYDLYNSRAEYVRKFTVKLADFAFEKGVFVQHQLLDGTYEQIPLYYAGEAEEGFELWTARVATSEPYYGNKFIIRYDVEGTTYIDNNNGQQYTLEERDGVFLGEGINLFRDRHYSYISGRGRFVVGVDVRNLAYEKQVTLVYTTDNWATVRTHDLHHEPKFYFGTTQYIPSPNVHNVERWSGAVNFTGPAPNFKYAIRYRVNGQEYWDNNYGRNYTAY